MKRYVMKAVSKLLAITVLSLPATAWAANVFNLQQGIAYANFSSTAGCISTDVTVIGVEATSHFPPTQRALGSTAYVSIIQSDVCTTFEVLRIAERLVDIADQEFKISNNLSTATLNTTVPLHDFVTGTDFPVLVNLMWTRTGSLNRANQHSYQLIAGCKTIFHSQGISAPTEVTGSVSEGVTNYTPEPAIFSNLSSGNSGNLTFTCQ